MVSKFDLPFHTHACLSPYIRIWLTQYGQDYREKSEEWDEKSYQWQLSDFWLNYCVLQDSAILRVNRD